MKSKSDEDRISRIDLLLLLLDVEDSEGKAVVEGMTKLQKLLFLVQDRLRKSGQLEGRYSFRPYTHGPFSREIYYDLDWLESEGVAEIIPVKLGDMMMSHRFVLTSKGIAEAQAMLSNPKYLRIMQVVKEVKGRYNSMPLQELLDFVHSAYPDYKA